MDFRFALVTSIDRSQVCAHLGSRWNVAEDDTIIFSPSGANGTPGSRLTAR
jgi:hypothetical protein